ncbi:hypothetical protein T08_14959 [Trichinella sp. T8]|nr:hypothetical protein T08_14959 [Trichinella sp. T8]
MMGISSNFSTYLLIGKVNKRRASKEVQYGTNF